MGTVAGADDFDALLDSIKSDYHSGRYQQGLDALQKAEDKIREARLNVLSAALPASIPGWQEVEVVNNLDELGLANRVEKDFVQSDKKIQFIIAPDQQFLAATIRLSGEPNTKISGIPATIFYDEKTLLGQLAIMPSPAAFIAIRGEGLSRKELTELASQLKLEMLTSFK